MSYLIPGHKVFINDPGTNARSVKKETIQIIEKLGFSCIQVSIMDNRAYIINTFCETL